jgi:dTDP-3-amino-3,4,6-trideoxy-alpha-D-glucose transaminase
MIPLLDLRPALEATAPEWRALLDRMHARAHYILGEQVESFERDFAAATGAGYAVGVGSGTSAIELCLRAGGIAGEVITSALTAPFTGLAILAAGAAPRFADIDPDTLLLDPEDAGNRMRKKTAAILPVHLYGQPCDLRRFAGLGRPLIQDACQAHGAHFSGQPLTRFSAYAAYSFYPTKNLGCLGDGGAVATDSRRAAARIRLLRDGGRGPNHVSLAPGVNSRLDEMQACYLSAFLPHLADWNARRAQIAALYDEALAGCDGVRIVRQGPDSVHHLYVIRVKRREKLRAFLAANGVGSGVHYPVPLHLHPTFSGCGAKRGDLPNAERAAREVLSLPMGPYLADADALQVAAQVRRFFKNNRTLGHE